MEDFHNKLQAYQQKKIIAQGLLDLALLSANAEQLRYILDNQDSTYRYRYVSLSLISCSLILQIIVAIVLAFKSRFNIENEEDYAEANRVDNFVVVGILLITMANVVSSAFAPNNTPSLLEHFSNGLRSLMTTKDLS